MSLNKSLQHDDTKISRTSVHGRGIPRNEAKKIHTFVSNGMNKLIMDRR